MADELGFEYKVAEPTNGVPAALEALAGDGYDKGNTIHKNVLSVLFDVYKASFLAGSLSTQVLENADILFGNNYKFTPLDKGGRSIGFVGGTN